MARENWTIAHDLALTLLAVVAREGPELQEYELAAVTDTLQDWPPGMAPDEAQDVVMEVLSHCSDSTQMNKKISGAVSAIGALPLKRRTQALECAIKMAKADLAFEEGELQFIRELATEWGVVGQIDALTLQPDETEVQDASWSLLHDIGLLYVALAHGADSELSTDEVEAMVTRLHAWQPKWSTDEIDRLLREVMEIYSQSESAVRKSVSTVTHQLPPVLRMLLLEDMMVIADADGKTTDNERAIIWSLSRAWGIGEAVR